MKKIASLIVAVPVAFLLLTLAIINRHSVRFVLDPIHPEAPALSIQLPFYVYLLGMLIAGVALGGLATWFNQGQHRTKARSRAVAVRRLQNEVERMKAERDAEVTAAQNAANLQGNGGTQPRSLLAASRG
jgi:uncharacterized integral membrane protein